MFATRGGSNGGVGLSGEPQRARVAFIGKMSPGKGSSKVREYVKPGSVIGPRR